MEDTECSEINFIDCSSPDLSMEDVKTERDLDEKELPTIAEDEVKEP